MKGRTIAIVSAGIATLALSLATFTWVYPEPAAVLGPVDVLYTFTTSSAGPNPVELNLKATDTGMPFYLTSLIVANPADKTATSPVVVTVDKLASPITSVEILPHNIPDFSFQSCTGQRKFDFDRQVGRRSFCIQISPFPARAKVGVMLFFSDPGSAISTERFFVGNRTAGQQAELVDIGDILSQLREVQFRLDVYRVTSWLSFSAVVTTILLYLINKRRRSKRS